MVFVYFLTLFFSLINDYIKIYYQDLVIDKKDFIIPFKWVRGLLHLIISITFYNFISVLTYFFINYFFCFYHIFLLFIYNLYLLCLQYLDCVLYEIHVWMSRNPKTFGMKSYCTLKIFFNINSDNILWILYNIFLWCYMIFYLTCYILM